MLIIIFSVLLMLALLFVKGRLELNLKKYAPYYAQNVEGRFSPEWEALRFMLYRDSRQIPGYHFKQDTLTSNIRFRVIVVGVILHLQFMVTKAQRLILLIIMLCMP